MDQQGFSDAVLELEFDRLDKKALSKYFDDVANAEQSGVSQQAQTQARRPAVAGADERAAEGIAGDARQAARGEDRERRAERLRGARLRRQGLYADHFASGPDGTHQFSGSAEASAALLRGWMAKDARAHAVKVLAEQGRPLDEAQVQLLSEQLVQQQLAALEATGCSNPRATSSWLRAEVSGGKLMLNGNAADQLLGPMLAPPPAAPVPALAPTSAS